MIKTKRIGILVLVIMTMIGGTGCMQSKKKTEGELTAYLEEAYDEKFVVEMFEKGSAYQKQEGMAYPEGKPELIFLVGKGENGTYDRYPLAKWGIELDEKYKGEVESQFPGAEFKTILRVFGGNYTPDMINMEVMEFLGQNSDATVTLLISIKTEGEPDPAQYAEETYSLLQRVGELNVKNYGVSILFVDPAEDMENYLRTAHFNNTQWTNLDKKIHGALMVNNHHDITGPNDIPQFYKRNER